MSAGVRVNGGGCRTGVPQVFLYFLDRGTSFQRVGGMGVAQPVGGGADQMTGIGACVKRR